MTLSSKHYSFIIDLIFLADKVDIDERLVLTLARLDHHSESYVLMIAVKAFV